MIAERGCARASEHIQMLEFIKKFRNESQEKRQKELDRRRELIQMVNDSYDSLRVVGRGTVRIDPREVSRSAEFQRAKELAKQIVSAQ